MKLINCEEGGFPSCPSNCDYLTATPDREPDRTTLQGSQEWDISCPVCGGDAVLRIPE